MGLPRAAGKAEAHSQQGRVQGIWTSSLVGMHLRSPIYEMSEGLDSRARLGGVDLAAQETEEVENKSRLELLSETMSQDSFESLRNAA